ncbi:hypothetical protein [Desulfoferrobacter suflitae]|uniref:hypothetical protein n=1 Tax=Desulfoferrobacter suflitae TaxID=2865782 RepID=UPI0021649B58|nr:hypothetical protein [Desulfoferrobacter suflitae]MCK8602262.1 hypothetical protein [Desulfoferrobacter suflitae]
MSVDPKALESKLREMYPDIDKYKFDLALNFNEQKDAWIVELKHGKHELTTHLERKDAEACLDGVQCVYLGVQIGQFVKNFEAQE